VDDLEPVAVQARRVRELFEDGERTGRRFMVTVPVVLELLWVLSAVYELSRDDVLYALDLLSQMPILEFEDYEGAQRLIRLGNETKADLPDLLIGLAGRARECEATLTFERGLAKTGLFERV
jgi:predicted nucleic-acid-binding protein